MAMEVSVLEAALRALLSVHLGKEGEGMSNDLATRKYPSGTLVKKLNISVTLRHGGVTKRFERKYTQHAVF